MKTEARAKPRVSPSNQFSRDLAPLETISKLVMVTEHFGARREMLITLPRLRFLEKQS